MGGDDSSRPELAAAAAAASPPPPIMLSYTTPTFCLSECDCATSTCDQEEGRQKATIDARQ